MWNPPEEAVIGGCNEHKIAATIPCGHFFHHICIINWLHTGRSSTKLCPHCNLPFQGCLGLYMDPSMFRGPGLDDDVSLSSIEDNKESVSKEYDCHCHDDDVESDDTNIDDGVIHQAQNQKCGGQVDQSNQNSATAVIDLCESSDLESVISSARPGVDSSGSANLIGNSKIQNAPPNPVSAGKRRKKSTTTSKNVGTENDEIRRMTKIAKFYKMQHKQKEKLTKQLQEDVSDLSNRLGEKETKVENLIAAEESLKRMVDRVESKLDRNRHQLEKVTKDRDSLMSRNSLLESENDGLKIQMKELKQRYEKDLEDARGETMPEFRQMTRKIRELEELQRRGNLGPAGPITNTKGNAKVARASTQLVREFSQKEQAMKTPLRYRMSLSLRASTDQTESMTRQRIDMARYSSNAARMVLGSSQHKERKLLHDKNDVVMEQLLSESPPKQKTNTPVDHTASTRLDLQLFRLSNRPTGNKSQKKTVYHRQPQVVARTGKRSIRHDINLTSRS
jgi:hypothetical protein